MSFQRIDQQLNESCFCIEVDEAALWGQICEGGADLRIGREHLFSSGPVFVARADHQAMVETVHAIEAAAALPAWRDAALGRAPQIARADHGPRGAFMGYDFHLSPDGPRLIEVNTNAGGAFLNALLGPAQLACCPEVAEAIDQAPFADFEAAVWRIILAEWRLQGRHGAPGVIAIVDDAPQGQFLYPEFLIAQRLFERQGATAIIVDAADLAFADGRLSWRGQAIDLVYNRLTDFALIEPRHAALAAAYSAGAAVVTPSPHHHALYADKRNLIELSDPERMAAWGLDAGRRGALSHVPSTLAVTPETADDLWARRKALFFKPTGGYGGKAVYRGDKLTRGVFAEILQGGYIAQALAPPSERQVQVDGAPTPRKVDVRLYAYAGEILLTAARVYQGQTTNFRTPGGGFAPVILV
jgi:glutathione synthase/RimK-type ligase-like ATP-grasp enzyme